MVPPRPALWLPPLLPLLLLLLLLRLGLGLGLAARRAGPRGCSVPAVLRHYRAVIFEDLQAAVRRGGRGLEGTPPSARPPDSNQKGLTRAGAAGRLDSAGASCSAHKEHSVLLSIVSLGQTLQGALAGGRRGALERAAWTVAVRTEAAMQHHCGVLAQRTRGGPETHRAWCPPGRRLLLRTLATLAACWEKLFALRAQAPGAK